MNIAPVNELHAYDMDEYEDSQFQNVIEKSQELNLEVTTLLKPLPILKMILRALPTKAIMTFCLSCLESLCMKEVC